MKGYIFFSCILFLYVTTFAAPTLTQEDIIQLRTYTPFSLSQKTELTPALIRHFETYGTNKKHFESFGHRIHKHDTLALFYFLPPNPQGLVVLIHGYFDNSGTLSNIRNHLTENGYAVLSMDLPGHGLSSGKRASIDDFSNYSEAVSQVVKIAQKTKLPIHTLGHSTGCSPLIDLMLRKEKRWSGETILVAPLVRSAMWGASKLGAGILKPFASNTKRIYRNSSHDELFKQSVKEDPLGVKQFPVEWSSALYEWNRIIEARAPINDNVFIIQGTKDGTVDWQYNMKFLKEKIPNASINTIENGRHHLLNETPLYRDKVFSMIQNKLMIKNGGKSI